MAGENKTSLSDIVVGDSVAHRCMGGRGSFPMRIVTIAKVTSSRFIISNGTKFRRDNGIETTANVRKDRIYPLSATNENGLIYSLAVIREQVEETLWLQKQKYVGFISRLTEQTLTRLDTATLEQAARLLGYAEEAK